VRIFSLRARDYVELTPTSEHQLGATEVFEMGTEATKRPSRAFGDHAELAVLPRVEREDAVGLTEIHPAEHNGFAAIKSL
jgi:hypothetical protein